MMQVTTSATAFEIELKPDPFKRIIFARALPRGLIEGVKVHPWRWRQKLIVLKTFKRINKRAPGLVARAVAYRPVSLYVLKRAHGATARASIAGNHIELAPRFFTRGPRGRLAVLAHELTHLVDSGAFYSGSAEFTALIQPRIEAARAHLEKRKRSWFHAVRHGWRTRARTFGLPGAYALFSQYEALAESVGQMVAQRFHVPANLRAYLEAITNTPIPDILPAMVKWHDAQRLIAQGGDVAHIKQALLTAVGFDPQFLKPRLLLMRLNHDLPDTGCAGDVLVKTGANDGAPFLKSEVYHIAALRALLGRDGVCALSMADKAIAHLPTAPGLYVLRAQAYLELKRPKQALADMARARALGGARPVRQVFAVKRRARLMIQQQRKNARKRSGVRQ